MGGVAGNFTLVGGMGTDARGGTMSMFGGAANFADAGDLELGTGRALQGRAGNITVFVDRGDVGVGGNITVTAGLTTDKDMPGGSVNVNAGIGDNDTGGRGGVVQIDGGVAKGYDECVLKQYVCAGIEIDVAVYEAVIRGCTSDCNIYGLNEIGTYLCGELPVSAEHYLAVLGGCTQK